MATDKFEMQFGNETYDAIPSGDFINRGYIGLVSCVRRWDSGFAKEEVVTADGKKYPANSRVYLSGDKEAAVEFAKQYMGLEFVSAVLLCSTPLASVTNLSDETKAKFKNPIIQTAARLQGFAKDGRGGKHGAGFNFVTAPSIVDAYARVKGWYDKPLFDVNAIGDIHNVADVADLIDKLIETRKVIWSALGAKDWKVNNAEEAGDGKLGEALGLFFKSWNIYARMHTVHDPSPSAYYQKKEVKEGEDKSDRNRVPAVTEFFSNERTAVAAGQLELAESTTAQADGKLDVTKIWSKLSDEARFTYGDASGLQLSIAEIMAELAKKTPPIKVAKLYGLKVADLELLAR